MTLMFNPAAREESFLHSRTGSCCFCRLVPVRTWQCSESRVQQLLPVSLLQQLAFFPHLNKYVHRYFEYRCHVPIPTHVSSGTSSQFSAV